MAETTGIQWTDATHNPWIGCQKVSPACVHCYAAVDSPARISRKIGLELWGPETAGAKRRVTSDQNWSEPLKWNRKAEKQGKRLRVFCASQADVFEDFDGEVVNHKIERVYLNNDPDFPITLDHVRRRLWMLIADTPHLDWLLLTKRPENVMSMVPYEWRSSFPSSYGFPPNVWLGVTVENQEYASKRIPHLLRIPARIRFLSCEPLLGPLELSMVETATKYEWYDALHGQHRGGSFQQSCPTLSWVIAGGESGLHARPSHLDWFRSLRDQCVVAKVPFFFKQHGEWCPFSQLPVASLSEVELDRRDTTVIGENSYHRLGKKLSGRLLDGVEWNEVPA